MEEFFNNLFRHICPTGVKRLCLDSSTFLKSWFSCSLFLWVPLCLEDSARSALRAENMGLFLDDITKKCQSALECENLAEKILLVSSKMHKQLTQILYELSVA